MTGAGGSEAAAPLASLSFKEFYEGAKHEPVYVILGVQGSGTNLLRRILDPAFNFSVVQDQALVVRAAAALGARPTETDVRRQFESLLPRMLPTPLTRKTLRRVKTNGSFSGIAEAFDASLVHSAAEFAQCIYAYSAFSRGTRLMAIKSDDLWETIDSIDAVLPNRRIILLTRDFRDNLLSITNKDFGPRHPLMAAAYVKERFAPYAAEYARTAPERRFHVTFEELLDDPNGLVSRFASHFDITKEGETPGPLDTGKIRRNNRRKWASLPARQLAWCESVLREELETFGYGTETQPGAQPSSTDWAIARAQDFMMRVPQKLSKLADRLRR